MAKKQKDACKCQPAGESKSHSRMKKRKKRETEKILEISIPSHDSGIITRFQCCITYDESVKLPEVKNNANIHLPQLVEVVLPMRQLTLPGSRAEKSFCHKLEHFVVVIGSSILLISAFALVFYWVMHFRQGLTWIKDTGEIRFNLHPIFTIMGYIVISGFSILLPEIFDCWRTIYVQLLHAFLHVIAFACAMIALVAVSNYHGKAEFTHFYSLHSWIGGVTEVIFILQFIVAAFNFYLMIFWRRRSARFRETLEPVTHVLGVLVFMLAVACALTGVTESALHKLGDSYRTYSYESLLLNIFAMVLVLLAIVITIGARGSSSLHEFYNAEKYYYDRL